MKEYELISNLVVEAPNKKVMKEIMWEFQELFIELVENRKCYVGGGFSFKECVNADKFFEPPVATI